MKKKGGYVTCNAMLLQGSKLAAHN